MTARLELIDHSFEPSFPNLDRTLLNILETSKMFDVTPSVAATEYINFIAFDQLLKIRSLVVVGRSGEESTVGILRITRKIDQQPGVQISFDLIQCCCELIKS